MLSTSLREPGDDEATYDEEEEAAGETGTFAACSLGDLRTGLVTILLVNNSTCVRVCGTVKAAK